MGPNTSSHARTVVHDCTAAPEPLCVTCMRKRHAARPSLPHYLASHSNHTSWPISDSHCVHLRGGGRGDSRSGVERCRGSAGGAGAGGGAVWAAAQRRSAVSSFGVGAYLCRAPA